MSSLSLSCFSESTLATSLTDVATSGDTVPPCKAESNILNVFWSDLSAPCSSERWISNCCHVCDTICRFTSCWDTLCEQQKVSRLAVNTDNNALCKWQCTDPHNTTIGNEQKTCTDDLTVKPYHSSRYKINVKGGETIHSYSSITPWGGQWSGDGYTSHIWIRWRSSAHKLTAPLHLCSSSCVLHASFLS